MRLCSFEHEPFEDVGLIADWMALRNHQHSVVKLYDHAPLPDIATFDAYIIMGGGMGANDDNRFPWLTAEKDFLKKAYQHKLGLLGICLGAQLLSITLGGTVRKNEHKEIGWFPVLPTSTPSRLFPNQSMTVFQWHGDTFSIPPSTLHTFSSQPCHNQSFESENGKIVGLQFHIETNQQNVQRLIEGAPQDLLPPGPFIQSTDKMLSSTPSVTDQFALLCHFLDAWSSAVLKEPSYSANVHFN